LLVVPFRIPKFPIIPFLRRGGLSLELLNGRSEGRNLLLGRFPILRESGNPLISQLIVLNCRLCYRSFINSSRAGWSRGCTAVGSGMVSHYTLSLFPDSLSWWLASRDRDSILLISVVIRVSSRRSSFGGFGGTHLKYVLPNGFADEGGRRPVITGEGLTSTKECIQ
jgi:hypothetical protein